MKRPIIHAPASLTEMHRLEDFRCGDPTLESWLRQRAQRNQRDGASRCFVVCAGKQVVGYYALAAGAVSHAQVPGGVRRNMPDPMPVVVRDRLAVHADWAGQGIGAGLLKDDVVRALRLSHRLGIRALPCHAIHDEARRFYLHHGFVESPIEPLPVMRNLTKLPAIE